MRNKFTDNLSIKFLSIIIATIIWAIVTSMIRSIVSSSVNTQVSLVNEETIIKMNKTFSVKDPLLCKITYQIDQEQAGSVRQSDFRTYIDLNDLLKTNDLPIHCEVLNEADKYVMNVKVEPSTIHVVLDDVVRKEFQVEYKAVGDFDTGHSLGDVILSPSLVYISASDDIIKNIAHVSIDIPVMSHEEMFSNKAEVHIIGNDGNEIPKAGIGLSADVIDYTVSMFVSANVALSINVEGKPASGYYFIGALSNPESIMLEGPRNVVENIYTLELPSINIEGASESFEQKIALKDILPVGTRCSQVDEVSIAVAIDDNTITEPTAKEEENLHGDEEIAEESKN